MKKRLFVKNAAIMTITSLLLRSIGILFRIYVSNRVGAEGMGLYQLIISVYVLSASFASAGMTTAVTRLCTDELAKGSAWACKRILRYGILISTGIALLSSAVLIWGAPLIATVCLHDVRAVPSLRILTISLPFMGISSCVKGYFLARRKVTSSSVAQILEQLVRIFAIVCILTVADVTSVEGSCFVILVGDGIAEATACLYIVVCYNLDKKRIACTPSQSAISIVKPMLRISLPITSGRYLSSGLRTVENIIVPTALTVFTLSRETALSQFGKIKGMALPLIFFPSSFLNAFTALLIPEISEAKALSQQRRLTHTINQTLQITLLSSILIGGLFWVLSVPLGEMIYHDAEVGMMMKLLAPLAPIMYLESVVVGVLKGLDQQAHSLLYSVLDSGSRIGLIIVLLPKYGIWGFYGVMVFSNLLTCLLNVYRLLKVSALRFRFGKWLIKPIISILLAVFTSELPQRFGVYSHLGHISQCILTGIVISGIYIACVWYMRCIEKEDMLWIQPISAYIRKSARN